MDGLLELGGVWLARAYALYGVDPAGGVLDLENLRRGARSSLANRVCRRAHPARRCARLGAAVRRQGRPVADRHELGQDSAVHLGDAWALPAAAERRLILIVGKIYAILPTCMNVLLHRG